jgi:translation initiation factor 3 subunit C
MLTTVERMDEEFVKILKECDAHSNEYVERLKDETRVTAIIDSLQSYIERQSLPAELCRLYMRKIEHMYYKFDPNTIKLHNVRSAYRSINFFFINFIEFSCRMRRKSRKIPP